MERFNPSSEYENSLVLASVIHNKHNHNYENKFDPSFESCVPTAYLHEGNNNEFPYHNKLTLVTHNTHRFELKKQTGENTSLFKTETKEEEGKEPVTTHKWLSREFEKEEELPNFWQGQVVAKASALYAQDQQFTFVLPNLDVNRDKIQETGKAARDQMYVVYDALQSTLT